mmetsp:Transcript_30788/g.28014  ORF Transcript_30788/g.28014 Transcript_30788/m.28014 type:complete len:178 (+) Transcript_30788:178-711(+)
MLRCVKEGNKVVKAIKDWLKFRQGVERFLMTLVFFFIFCHVACCIWYLLATLNSDDPTNWIEVQDMKNESNFRRYIVAFYYICATVVTVGYGDVSGNNTMERIFAVFLMFTGAFNYSFIVGSLSTIILSSDSRERDYEKKTNTLIEIRQKYKIDSVLFKKIRRALKYGYTNQDDSRL